MFSSKKKQRSGSGVNGGIRSLLDEEAEECMMKAIKGSSKVEQQVGNNVRLMGMILVALALCFMYFVFLFSSGSGECGGLIHPCRSSEDLARELDKAMENQDEELQQQELGDQMIYMPDEDGDPEGKNVFPEMIGSSSSTGLPPTVDHHHHHQHQDESKKQQQQQDLETGLGNLVFGIAASAKLWEKRQEYVKLWWRPGEMRGFVWLDRQPGGNWSSSLPPMRISEDTSRFNYTNRKGGRSAIRISRVVSETFRMGLPDVHWFVMGDDDTVFVPENLVKVLSKYDHTKPFYIGSHSESHTQNIHFSYNMAYGGGGFAISYPLAKALERIQDRCINKYPYLYGSDDRIQACVAELGVPLTKEAGFHQFDIYGDAFGLLSAHPVTPLVSIHHLDLIDPIFPNSTTQSDALKHLKKAMRVDPSGLLQQSICYDRWRRWSISVSWGYAIQVYRNIIPPRILELPMRTFWSWYRKSDDMGFPFNTRPLPRNPCDQPAIFYMEDVGYGDEAGESRSDYVPSSSSSNNRGECKNRLPTHSPSFIQKIHVIKEQTDETWHLAPRRQCCRVVSSSKKYVELSVGDCESGETII